MNKSIKTLLAFTAIAAMSLTASARTSYRGFVDIIGAYPIFSTNVNDGFATDNDGQAVWINLSTTHGVQLNRHFFIGAGAGLYDLCRFGEITLTQIPIYIAGRADLNISKKCSPFIDLKIGYSANLNNGCFSADIEGVNDYTYSYENGYEYASPYISTHDPYKAFGQFFFQPTIGIRFRLGHHLGLNLGLTYYCQQLKESLNIYERGTDGYGNGDFIEQVNLSWKNNYLGLNIGIDF